MEQPNSNFRTCPPANDPQRDYSFRIFRLVTVVLGLSHFGAIADLQAQSLLNAIEKEIEAIVVKARPAVVTVTAINNVHEGKGLLGMFGGGKSEIPKRMVGSGLVVSSDGFILTKESIVRKANRIEVTLNDGSFYDADLIEVENKMGVALLKIGASRLEYVEIGGTDELHSGSWVTVIGNAVGVPQAVSVGVVSAVQTNGIIQITAQVDPGSNGSPVFGTSARAVGIVAGRMSLGLQDQPSESIFSQAVSVYALAPLLPFMRESVRKYYDSQGWIGVTLLADTSAQGRPRVLSLVENGPAARAGLQVGDVITSIANQTVDSLSQLGRLVAQARPDEKVSIGIDRDGTDLTLEVRVAKREAVALAELKLLEEPAEWKPQPWRKMAAPAPAASDPAAMHRRLDALEQEIKALRSMYIKPQ